MVTTSEKPVNTFTVPNYLPPHSGSQPRLGFLNPVLGLLQESRSIRTPICFLVASCAAYPLPRAKIGMEHLHHGPKPVDLEFLYLSETDFDFDGEWLQYPDHEGIDLDKIRYLSWAKLPPAKLSQVLQNWLFFGLLRAIIPQEISIQVKDFIRIGESGQRFISTAKLPEYLASWVELQRNVSVEEKQLIDGRNKPILKEAQGLTHRLSSLPYRGLLNLHLFLPVSLEIALSCALLGEALALTNAALVGGNPGWSWSSGDLLCERLEIDGWCPFIVSGFQGLCRLSTIHYCATLGGPKVKLNHRKCTDKLCIHTEITKARHSKHDCPCSVLKPEIEEVVSVILRKQTPILRYVKGKRRDKLETGEASDSITYVAISHVWSDGLGNPDGNQMNKCQLERVQMAVDRLSSENRPKPGNERWWWLDTLCVPKGDAYKKEEAETISRMKEIYTKADKVLIIDAGLSACDSSTDILEILARFRLSNWIRRLWTIQEGLFARRIYLLVGDTPKSLSFLISEAKRLPQDGFQYQIGQDLISDYESIFGLSIFMEDDSTSLVRFEAIPTETRIIGVLETLALRTSTFLRDEPLCLALLLGVDTIPISCEIENEQKEKAEEEEERKKVEEEERKKEEEEDEKKKVEEGKANPSKEKNPQVNKTKSGNPPSSPGSGASVAGMVKFLELANEVSRSFDPPGCIPPSMISLGAKRLDKPGFRWAPESFLYSSGEILHAPFVFPNPDDPQSQITRPSGILCANGLRVMFPGIRITEIRGDKPVEQNFLVDTSADEHRNAYMPAFWKASYSESEHEKGGFAPTEEDSNQLAIIICTYGNLNVSGCTAVLVRIRDTAPDGTLIVERMCTLAVARTPPYDDQEWITEPWKRVKGTWLPVTQKWCVD